MGLEAEGMELDMFDPIMNRFHDSVATFVPISEHNC